MAWAAIAVTVASTIFSAMAAKKEGAQRQDAAEYSAQVDEQNAGQQQASAQRTAMEERRKGQLAQSRALAIAAASGAGASDPTATDIISDLNAEGTYRGMLAMYEGEDKSRLLKQNAAAKRYGGDVAVEAGNTAAVASILKGGSSLFMKYAPSGGFSGGSSAPTSAGTPFTGNYG